jgi:hypothetical protein
MSFTSRPRNAATWTLDGAVVALEAVTPFPVAEFSGKDRRADDVGEEHGREDAVVLDALACARHERRISSRTGPVLPRERNVIGSR